MTVNQPLLTQNPLELIHYLETWLNKNETFQTINFTVLPQRDEISVNDCESSNDRRRVLLLENVDDELRLGDVAGLVRRAKAEVELLVVRLQVERPVQEHAARVAFQSK